MNKFFLYVKVTCITILLFVSVSLTGIADIDQEQMLMQFDDSLPTLQINFAGNLSDLGGPHWMPPGESQNLTSHDVIEWRNGYYANDSRQQEDWIYINVTVSDTDGVEGVLLHWNDKTTETWINESYHFHRTTDNFWEFNSSGVITNIQQGHDYTFDVYAIDFLENSNISKWEKVGLHGIITRRYIQLNCTPESIEYNPFYLYKTTPETGIYSVPTRFQKDRLHHDQGPADTETDTGYLNSTVPGDHIEKRSCMVVTAYFFEDNVCTEPFELKNVYFHYWYGTSKNGLSGVSVGKTRVGPGGKLALYDPPDKNGSYSKVTLGAGNIYLDAHLLAINPKNQTTITDNNVYETVVMFTHQHASGGGSVTSIQTVSNRSFISYVLFNVPDNETLNATHQDTDGDLLSDWTELYKTYTSPFHMDTDDDGATDYEEANGAYYGFWNSDPNNYTDTTEFRYLPRLHIEIRNGLKILIQNQGPISATNIKWNVSIEGGLIVIPRESSGTIDNLQPDETKEVSFSVFGIGLGIITIVPEIIITAKCDEGTFSERSTFAKIFFSKVLLE